MAKLNRPTWFKIFLHQFPIIMAVPDDVAGRALKAAMCYFDSGDIVELEPLESILFSSFKEYIDECVEDYALAVENGRKGGRPKKPTLTDAWESDPS